MILKNNPYLRSYYLKNSGTVLGVINQFAIMLKRLSLIEYEIYSDIYDEVFEIETIYESHRQGRLDINDYKS